MGTTLITGAAGYLGRHLLNRLHGQPIKLHGTYRSHAALIPSVDWHQVDLCDADATFALIQRLQPSQVYHLAGNIRAGRTAAETQSTWQDNLHATRHLYEACLTLSSKPRIVFVSSGAVYGQQPDLITEETPLAPLSAYGQSKAAADQLSDEYSLQHRLPIIRARLFNYLGPGLGNETALGRFAAELARLECLGEQPAVLETGSLAAERDLLHVKDVVTALVVLMDHGTPGEAYNIASGVSHPMRWYVEEMLRHIRIPIAVMEHAVSRAEATTLLVCNAKLQALGWAPTITIDDGLREMIDSWRSVH